MVWPDMLVDHVTRLGGAGRWACFRRSGIDADEVDLGLQLGRWHACVPNTRGGAAHVELHLVHVGGRLQRDATGVEGDALAHQHDRRRPSSKRRGIAMTMKRNGSSDPRDTDRNEPMPSFSHGLAVEHLHVQAEFACPGAWPLRPSQVGVQKLPGPDSRTRLRQVDTPAPIASPWASPCLGAGDQLRLVDHQQAHLGRRLPPLRRWAWCVPVECSAACSHGQCQHLGHGPHRSAPRPPGTRPGASLARPLRAAQARRARRRLKALGVAFTRSCDSTTRLGLHAGHAVQVQRCGRPCSSRSPALRAAPAARHRVPCIAALAALSAAGTTIDQGIGGHCAQAFGRGRPDAWKFIICLV